jgi:hypothetical protein
LKAKNPVQTREINQVHQTRNFKLENVKNQVQCRGKRFHVIHRKFLRGNGIFLPKLFRPTVRKNCSRGPEKLLKFKAEGGEFSNF